MSTAIITFGEYRQGRLLGRGAYSCVYAAIGQPAVALKVHHQPSPLLDREIMVYRHLWQHLEEEVDEDLRVPRLLWEGRGSNSNRAIALTRLGVPLGQTRNRSTQRICRIAVDGLRLLRGLHRLGLVHRDVKPDNFVYGHVDSHRLYLIDFGLAAQYLDQSGAHLPPRDGLTLIGSAHFASANAQLGIRPSRRDDLESLGYLLLHGLRGRLPWRALEDAKQIASLKWRYVEDGGDGGGDGDGGGEDEDEDAGGEGDGLSSIRAFIRYAQALEYTQTPEYDSWISHFRRKI